MKRLMIPMTLLAALVVGTLLGSAPPPTAKGEFPAEWYYGNRRPDLIAMEGKRAPALAVRNWIGEAQNLKKLKGKVVVLDFWATWCGPCKASIPKNNALVEKHAKDGLVFIGVHESSRGSEKMADLAKQYSIKYPLCVDNNSKSVKSYKVHFYPTYVVIDRKGVVRAAGLEPSSVEKVVAKLLEEKVEEQPKKDGEKEEDESSEPAE